MTVELAVETRGLTRDFGSFRAVSGVDLAVPSGSFYGFLGPNGAGKSTTIKCLTGLLRPTSGQMRILDVDPLANPVEVKQKTGAWGRNAPLEPDDAWFLDGLAPGKAPTDTDNDGMPDAWERRHGLDPKDPADATRIVPAGKSQGDRHRGYTYIEFYVNELADAIVPPYPIGPR